jgi:hypothetical protein
LEKTGKSAEKQKPMMLEDDQNPFLSFKLDREKLMKVFAN